MDFGGSPLLSYPTAAQAMQADTDALIQQMEQMKQRQNAINMQVQVSPTPLWDEIDKVEDTLTDGQRQILMQNQDYVDSLQLVSKMVRDEELRIIRPRIERTDQGKDALKRHLSIVTKLKREIAKEAERQNDLVTDFIKNYPGKTWEEYLAIVNGQSQNRKGGKK